MEMRMKRFKVGDIVRIKWNRSHWRYLNNQIGIITQMYIKGIDDRDAYGNFCMYLYTNHYAVKLISIKRDGELYLPDDEIVKVSEKEALAWCI